MHAADTTTSTIAEALTRAIAAHRLQPGTKLAEQQLADHFGVSRTLVRQALFQLSQNRLVRLEPARGAFVATPSVEEARQVFEVRRMVEGSLVRQLASRITTSSKLGTALEADKELQKLVKKEAAAMMAEPASFDWLVKGKGGPQARAFNQWRGRVFKSEVFDNDTRLLMTWLVSRPEQTQEEWTMGVDSMGVDTCLRGPMRLTFRQSKNLGFTSRLDGWSPGGSASVETPDARKELLSRTATIRRRAARASCTRSASPTCSPRTWARTAATATRAPRAALARSPARFFPRAHCCAAT
jgi:DNA-binding transcriptional regulator YhcF (GntR family)